MCKYCRWKAKHRYCNYCNKNIICYEGDIIDYSDITNCNPFDDDDTISNDGYKIINGENINYEMADNLITEYNCRWCENIKKLPMMINLKKLKCHETLIKKIPHFYKLEYLSCSVSKIPPIQSLRILKNKYIYKIPYLKNLEVLKYISKYNYDYKYICYHYDDVYQDSDYEGDYDLILPKKENPKLLLLPKLKILICYSYEIIPQYPKLNKLKGSVWVVPYMSKLKKSQISFYSYKNQIIINKYNNNILINYAKSIHLKY